MFLDQLSCICKRIINVFDKCPFFEDSSMLDTSWVSNCHLIVRVKDLGTQSPGNCALATLEIAIMENTQVSFSFQYFWTYLQIISKVIQETLIFKIIKLRWAEIVPQS